MYDTCYRRKAANNKSLEWGKVDFNLYNETFTEEPKQYHGVCSAQASYTHLQPVLINLF